MSKTTSQAILLDLDGTLVDSRKDLAAAANASRAALGLDPLAIETIASYVGDGLAKLLERSCPHMDQQAHDEAHRAFHAYYSEHCCDHTHMYPGIDTLLQRLSADGCSLAVVTNKPKQYADHILERLGIAPLMALVCGGDEKRKPDPSPLVDTCKSLGLSLSAAWMCGDHHTDIIAARRAGCRSIWCSWGIGEHAGEAFDYACDSPEQIYQVICGD